MIANLMPRTVLVLALLLAASLFPAARGMADEPLPEDFPPAAPAEPPPARRPPVVQPEAPVPPNPPSEPGGAWSPPAVTPGGSGSALPPPVIVHRRSTGLPPAPRATDLAPPMPPAPSQPTIRDLRDARSPHDAPTPGSGLPERPPSPRQAAPTGPATAVRMGTPAPVLPTAPSSGTRVFNIAKSHNVPLADGDLAVQLDVDYEVRGQAGREAYVAIWFVRKDTGRHIASALPAYADPSGLVTLQTRSARVQGAVARYAATLRIPYRCFPIAPGDAAYDVEARVQILRREASGGASSLARGETTFRVYGPAPAADPTAREESAGN